MASRSADYLSSFRGLPVGVLAASIDHSGPKGGDGLVFFIALFCSFAWPIVSPWKQVQPLCCLCFGQMDAEWRFLFCSPPPPLFGIKAGGEGITRRD